MFNLKMLMVGGVTHHRLAVDSERPTSIEISQASGYDLGNPNQILSVKS